MYVSKELAFILKEKGFDEPTLFDLYYTFAPNHINVNAVDAWTEHQVIDWVFDLDKFYPEQVSGCNIELNVIHLNINKHLQFWYTILLEHKFSLMHEFIGRLEEWFEKCSLYINIQPYVSRKTKNIRYQIEIMDCIEFHTWSITNDDTLEDIYEFEMNQKQYITKQQAKHEAILKCFELLKKNNNYKYHENSLCIS